MRLLSLSLAALGFIACVTIAIVWRARRVLWFLLVVGLAFAAGRVVG